MREKGLCNINWEGSLDVPARVVALPQTRSFLAASHPLQSLCFFLRLIFGVFTTGLRRLEHVDLILVLLLLPWDEVCAILDQISAAKDSDAILEGGVLLALMIEGAFCLSVVLDGGRLVVLAGPAQKLAQRAHHQLSNKLFFYFIGSFLADLMLEGSGLIGRPLRRFSHDQSFARSLPLGQTLLRVIFVLDVFHV